jgi:hypothetical protein
MKITREAWNILLYQKVKKNLKNNGDLPKRHTNKLKETLTGPNWSICILK